MLRKVTVQSNAAPVANLLAFALGAAAVGAIAIGALAIGRVAIDRRDQEGTVWQTGGR